MGETAEMILEGTLCEACGSVVEDIVLGEKAPGYPRTCDDCLNEERKELIRKEAKKYGNK
ncbi:hypothetical protein [Enterococcus sp. AZ007]|uniref:hypothetical protein n=1 Tax=Enterococcus sp. AZ007 TaxID=2774839 RepID=UPI003F2055E2